LLYGASCGCLGIANRCERVGVMGRLKGHQQHAHAVVARESHRRLLVDDAQRDCGRLARGAQCSGDLHEVVQIDGERDRVGVVGNDVPDLGKLAGRAAESQHALGREVGAAENDGVAKDFSLDDLGPVIAVTGLFALGDERADGVRGFFGVDDERFTVRLWAPGR
jgi:hypothetical protein